MIAHNTGVAVFAFASVPKRITNFMRLFKGESPIRSITEEELKLHRASSRFEGEE